MAHILGCDIGSFPFTYLGIPIGANMRSSKNWEPVISRFQRKLSGWKARTLSFAGKITLAKSVLGSLPSYYLSLFKAPKNVLATLEGLRRSFVWGKSEAGNKICWVKWDKITRPKMLGGLGVGGLREFNISMLAK
jgi:hypothetical protein